MAVKATSARKFRLYPEPDSAVTMAGWCHTTRAIWNIALDHRQIAYRTFHRPVSAAEQSRELTGLREACDWVRELPAQAGQQVLAQLDRAYRNWWANPRHFSPPKHKNRRSAMSFTLPGQAVKVERLGRRWAQVHVPKLGWVRFRLDGRWAEIKDSVRNCTISFKAGWWHVAFGTTTPLKVRTPEPGSTVGIDVGVTNSVTLSRDLDGRRRMSRPKTLSDGQARRLLGLERRKARQVKGSNRYNRTCEAIAKLQARRARIRLDWTHKTSDRIASVFETVWAEDLKIKNMTASAAGTLDAPGRNVRAKAGLNRAILDEQWGELYRHLGYKAAVFGRRDPRLSSQTCSKHGTRGFRLKEVFLCAECGPSHADENAAVNIETGGHLASLNSTQKPALAAACTAHPGIPFL